ncbi:hypothetical protein [Phycicoccus flavus]|uniref:Uncharacterized protein n=1 Tax=Phycicoccus flavus TaxID=2502783 RepID=A0A8T6R4H8_9MICO|nr:hypothetical protein [Phycicoccus flavus]NHA68370.1 hypothetical protein [Phycicoccus flavus]
MTDPTTGDAGAATAVPASPSAPGGPGADVVDAAARTELDRIRRRWSELPLAKAQAAAADVRRVVDEVAARTVPPATTTVPDLGPAVLADQLAVVVWDAYAAGRADGVAELLTGLRRSLP